MKLQAYKDAKIENAYAINNRWPTVIFSHGLSGNRNCHSILAGSLASHGAVVFCPEHRDGSAISTVIRDGKKHSTRVVPFKNIALQGGTDVHEAREAQLRIRFWELNLLYEVIMVIDVGKAAQILSYFPPEVIQGFCGKLHIQDPGSLIFAGHSFGAATVFQFVKSIFYANRQEVKEMKRLIRPMKRSMIRRQVSESTLLILLDMWCFPLLAPNSVPLFNLPLPVYTNSPKARGGNGILAIESESFFQWQENQKKTSLLLSPKLDGGSPLQVFERLNWAAFTKANLFYVEGSAHTSFTDFAMVLPSITKPILGDYHPQRTLRLSLRAQLQFLRQSGFCVSATNKADMVDGPGKTMQSKVNDARFDVSASGDKTNRIDDDVTILDCTSHGVITSWRWINVDKILNRKAAESSTKGIAVKDSSKYWSYRRPHNI